MRRRIASGAAGPAWAPVLALAALTLSGCLVGPNYAGPPPVAKEAIASGSFKRAEAGAVADPPPARWWLALGDAELDRLEDAALQSNPDVDEAIARLRQSRAALKRSRADLYPTTSASALALDSKGLTSAFTGGAGSSAGAGPGAAAGAGSAALDFYDAGVDATWQIDLFGGGRRAVEGARAARDAAKARLCDVLVGLEADVALAYVAVRDLQRQRALSRQDVSVETRMLDLVQRRRAGGAASDLDVERLTTELRSTQAQGAPLDGQIADQLDRLAILTGRAPGEVDGEMEPPSPPPLPPVRVAVGDPASLLRRRPDVRAAEQTIRQKSALIGQRTADLFPKVTLLGDVGFGSSQLSSLFTGGSFTYIAAPVLQWSPFDFGRTLAGVRQAKAERDEAMAAYRKAVLGALEDAETALAAYGRQRESLASLLQVEASADRASSMTRLRVEGGTATTLDQLDAERTRLSAEADVSRARAALTQDFIRLEKSLGLGWSAPPAVLAGGRPDRLSP